MFFMLDNYDSFVYNLSAYIRELGKEILVKRADEVTISEIEKMNPEGIILSPGPGKPSEAVLSRQVLETFYNRIPILGVCLGHQVICETFGGKVVKGGRPMHGKVTPITHSGKDLFAGIPEGCRVTRYHSLTAEKESLPECLIVDACAGDGTVMGVHHREAPIYGVQFHPEAVLTECGHELLKNFIRCAEEWRAHHADCKTA